MTEVPRTNKEWEYWGKADPMFGVLTSQGREKSGSNPWTVDEVREQGRKYFAEVYPHWQGYGVGRLHCLEIGCGTGRITRQLVDHFDQVTGVDVSAAQLASAKELLGSEADRVQLTLVATPVLPLADGACDGIFSCEVFQHFDADEPLAQYLRESFRVLTSKGTICFQVPLEGVTPATALASRLRNTILRVARSLGRRRMMIYRKYQAAALLALLNDTGFIRVEIRVMHSAAHGGFESYFFGTKP